MENVFKKNHMKTLQTILFLAIILLNINLSYSQKIKELTYEPLDNEFIDLKRTLAEIGRTDDQRSIDLCLIGLDKFKDMSVRNNLIYWNLSFHYASLEQYDKCFEILKQGQKEGLFYYTRTGSRAFPSYLVELENLEGYEAFIEQNTALREEASKTTETEYMIQLPDDYNENTKYPLIIIMHGGIGDIRSMQYNYISKKLNSDFIVAYFQGSNISGSFSRRFAREDWQGEIKQGYKQIISKYPVDTSNIILAGPSAGAYRSLVLGLNNEIPAMGLLLSFTVNPRVWDSTLYIKSAERGLKVALLCGENDWAIQQQKKLGYWLDKYGIKNRFVVFPEEGHGFPENWPYYLDTSLEFILMEDL